MDDEVSEAGLFKTHAVLALSAGDPEAALLAATRALDAGADAGALHLKAMALADLGRLDEAEAAQSKADEAGLPGYLGETGWEHIGAHHMQAGAKDRALGCFLRACACPGGTADSALKTAEMLLDRGAHADCLQLLCASAQGQADTGHPDRALSILGWGELLLESRDLDASALLPLMGECEAATKSEGFLKQVLENLDEEQDPSAEAWYALGCDLGKAGATEEALQAYRHATRLAPDHARAWVNLGLALQERGEPEKARRMWELALELDSGIPEAHQNLGMLELGEERFEEAEHHFQEAVRLRPEFSEAWNELGGLYLLREAFPEALAALRRATRLDPSAEGNWLRLGVALQETGDLDGAKRAVEKALILRPDYPQALNNLGVVLDNLDDREGALEAWRRALALDPDLDEARRNLDDAASDSWKDAGQDVQP